MHTLKNKEGLHYSFFGWTPDVKKAMQFRNAEEAADYNVRHKVTVGIPTKAGADARDAPPLTRTDFDPFKVRKA